MFLKNNLQEWPDNDGKVEWHYLSEKNANTGPLFIPRFLLFILSIILSHNFSKKSLFLLDIKTPLFI